MQIGDTYALLPLWYAVFLLSLTCHEAAHAFAAWRGGDLTAYLGGQVTLNPLPHMLREPIGTIVVPLLTYVSTGWMMGWASAPYDPSWEDRHPRRAALMASAGPLANLALAALAFAALKAGLTAGAWAPAGLLGAFDRLVVPAEAGPLLSEGLGRFLSILLVLNVLLFTFNLLPLPPLDGAGVLAGLSSSLRGLYLRLRETPFGSLAGLILAWTVFPHVFHPVFEWVLRRLY